MEGFVKKYRLDLILRTFFPKSAKIKEYCPLISFPIHLQLIHAWVLECFAH